MNPETLLSVSKFSNVFEWRENPPPEPTATQWGCFQCEHEGVRPMGRENRYKTTIFNTIKENGDTVQSGIVWCPADTGVIADTQGPRDTLAMTISLTDAIFTARQRDDMEEGSMFVRLLSRPNSGEIEHVHARIPIKEFYPDYDGDTGNMSYMWTYAPGIRGSYMSPVINGVDFWNLTSNNEYRRHKIAENVYGPLDVRWMPANPARHERLTLVEVVDDGVREERARGARAQEIMMNDLMRRAARRPVVEEFDPFEGDDWDEGEV